MKRFSKGGQAMMELLIGIIALVVILAGIVTFGEAGFYWLSSTTEAMSSAWTEVIREANLSGAGQRAPQLPIGQFVRTWDQNLNAIDIQNQDRFGTTFNHTMRDQKTYYNASGFFNGANGNRGVNEVLSSSTATNINYRAWNYPYVQRNLSLLVPGVGQNDANMFLMGSSSQYDSFALDRIGRQDGSAGADYRGTSGRSPLQSLVYGAESFNMHSDIFLPPITNVQ